MEIAKTIIVDYGETTGWQPGDVMCPFFTPSPGLGRFALGLYPRGGVNAGVLARSAQPGIGTYPLSCAELVDPATTHDRVGHSGKVVLLEWIHDVTDGVVEPKPANRNSSRPLRESSSSRPPGAAAPALHIDECCLPTTGTAPADGVSSRPVPASATERQVPASAAASAE